LPLESPTFEHGWTEEVADKKTRRDLSCSNPSISPLALSKASIQSSLQAAVQKKVTKYERFLTVPFHPERREEKDQGIARVDDRKKRKERTINNLATFRDIFSQISLASSRLGIIIISTKSDHRLPMDPKEIWGKTEVEGPGPTSGMEGLRSAVGSQS
jgi:hypothetical protein